MLYRCYDDAERLLYVGVTNDLTARMHLHKSNERSPWLSRLARTRVVWFTNRCDALIAERRATLLESPLYTTEVTGHTARGSAIACLAADLRLANVRASLEDCTATANLMLAESGYLDDTCITPREAPMSDGEWQERALRVAADAASLFLAPVVQTEAAS